MMYHKRRINEHQPKASKELHEFEEYIKRESDLWTNEKSKIETFGNKKIELLKLLQSKKDI
jgi:hypothetical protein